MHKVESSFIHNGLPCAIIFTSMGHRCGYVGVRQGSALYGVNYFESAISFEVHGGLTFSSDSFDYPVEIYDNLNICRIPIWWLGFDCAHAWDERDTDCLKKIFPEAYKTLKECGSLLFGMGGTVRTKGYVQNECISLANQIIKREESDCD